MATATESDVRAALPKEVEDQPSTDEITNEYLPMAAEKVAEYDLNSDTTKIKRAEQFYAAWQLVDIKYQIPQSSDRAGVSEDHAVDPATKLYNKFRDIVGGHKLRVV